MILVFGKTGQISKELQKLDGVIALGRDQADLSDPRACAESIWAYEPHAVINAAAYTAVDFAESNEGLATEINANGPSAMAQACAEIGIPLIHISTDYVFAGIGMASWSPNDPPAPQNAYGRSKLEGEIGIRASGATHAILRTSWVVSAHGNNFVKTMLRLSKTNESLNIVADQIGGPTPARDIALACMEIVKQLICDATKSGTYHFSGAPNISWADFAREIFVQSRIPVTIIPVTTENYPTPAKRPLNSRLNCTSTQHVFGIRRPDWKVGLHHILKDLEET